MHSQSINERVERIKGQEEEINSFIEEYKPFIASCVEGYIGRYVRYGQDDELSIAMAAFLEAIKAYDAKKGNFLAFARNVIKRRLIDYHRKEKRHQNVVSIHKYVGDEEEEPLDLTVGESLEEYSKEEISEYRRLELQELKEELKNYSISFLELTEASPKQEKTRKIYSDIIRFLLTQEDLIYHIKAKKSLPIVEIEKYTNVPRKTIERARKYIIAVVIIMTGDYQYVRDYVKWEVVK